MRNEYSITSILKEALKRRGRNTAEIDIACGAIRDYLDAYQIAHTEYGIRPKNHTQIIDKSDKSFKVFYDSFDYMMTIEVDASLVSYNISLYNRNNNNIYHPDDTDHLKKILQKGIRKAIKNEGQSHIRLYSFDGMLMYRGAQAYHVIIASSFQAAANILNGYGYLESVHHLRNYFHKNDLDLREVELMHDHGPVYVRTKGLNENGKPIETWGSNCMPLDEFRKMVDEHREKKLKEWYGS